jgi:hypothetical protein
VEPAVGLRHRRAVGRVRGLHLLLGAAHPHQVELGTPLGRPPGGGGLQRDPHVVDLEDLLRGAGPHPHPPRARLHEPVLLEAAQRLADGRAGGAVALRHRDLDERLARGQHAGDDVLTDARVQPNRHH